MTRYYDEELSEMAEVYKDKLEESMVSEGFPSELNFEDENGEHIRYIREDIMDEELYEEYK